MKEDINISFPRDSDTFSIIKEMEAKLGFQHKNIMVMNDLELNEYINKLTLLLILR